MMTSEKKYTIELTQDEANALVGLFRTVKSYPQAPFESVLCKLADDSFSYYEPRYGVFFGEKDLGAQTLEVRRVESW